MTQLHYDVQDHVVTLTIDSPPANALSTGLIQEIDQALTKIEKENEAKVVILRGEGKFFSAGADIKEFTDLQQASDYEQLSRDGQIVFNRLEHFPIPIIAAIHGAALGGGLELALSCHMRIVTEDAKLGLPELNLGIIPGFAGTQRLPKYVGKAKAYEMILTAEPITGVEAHQYGLANQVVEEAALNDTVTALAKKIVAKSKPTVEHVMHLARFAEGNIYDEGAQKEAEAFGQVFGNEDATEGIQAFLEKRPPKFMDK